MAPHAKGGHVGPGEEGALLWTSVVAECGGAELRRRPTKQIGAGVGTLDVPSLLWEAEALPWTSMVAESGGAGLRCHV